MIQVRAPSPQTVSPPLGLGRGRDRPRLAERRWRRLRRTVAALPAEKVDGGGVPLAWHDPIGAHRAIGKASL